MKPTLVEYTTVSKEAIELGNDFLGGKSSDATKIQSPHRQLIKKEEYHPGQDLLVQADQMAVDIEANEDSIDGLIDDIITIDIDDPNWTERTKNAALLVIHTIFRPLNSPETLKRDDPLSLRKILGEV